MPRYHLRILGLVGLFLACAQVDRLESGFWESAKNWVKDSVSFSPRKIVERVEDAKKVVSTPPGKLVGQAAGAVADQVDQGVTVLLKQFIPQFNVNNPYRYQVANVRVGTELAVEEQRSLRQRELFAKPALEKLLGRALPEGQMLRLAFCGSGGGYRAMLGTTGFLVGAQNIGLTDATLYMSGLSGSTWALGAFVTEDLPALQFKTQLQPKTQGMTKVNGRGVLPVPTKEQLDQVIYNLEVKKVFDQPLNSVDLWGALIVNKLFAPRAKRQNQYLTGQQRFMEDGRQLFPIYTAVQPLGNLKYHWFEFTPYEIGSADLQAFVPTWAFGRPFQNGQSAGVSVNGRTEYAPEQVFGFYLGIFGSAYTVNFTEMLNMMQQSGASDSDIASQKLKMNMMSGFVRAAWGVDDLHNQRLSTAELFNITYQMSGRPEANQEKISLIDAGLDFNLPLPPLLRSERQIDVIFVFDSSADIGKAGELRKAEADARRRGLKFPKIDYDQARTQAISVFRDPNDATVPTIIYLPLIKDPSLRAVQDNPILADFDPKVCTADGYCNTFNFEYPKDGFEKLTLLTQLNLESNLDLIRKTLLDVLELKYR